MTVFARLSRAPDSSPSVPIMELARQSTLYPGDVVIYRTNGEYRAMAQETLRRRHPVSQRCYLARVDADCQPYAFWLSAGTL